MNIANSRELIRQIPWSEARAAEPEVLLTREWLVTNGLGGYAAGTVSGIPTRRYDSFLVAAWPAPFGCMMLLPQLSEQLRLPDGTIVRLGGEERTGGAPQLYGVPYFSEFRLECGLPISLRHAVLAPARWQPVLKVVQQRLLTPVGLRSLAPDHPDYKARYDGDLCARDAAYRQGTVWAWLIGPFIDAWLKVYPDDYAGPDASSTALRHVSAKSVLAPSARSAMPKSRLRPVAASRRPEVWPKCCGAG